MKGKRSGYSLQNLKWRDGLMISDNIKITALSIAVSFLVSVGVVYMYDAYFVQKVVVFDVASYLDKQKTEFLAGKTDEEKLRKEFAWIKERIDALGEKRIVLSKDMVLSGGKDISDEISQYSEK
ncbi:hypothetical protein BROC_01970 [Candidatus Brocadiaceae bacterium]|nr:hypothetical protein BROC_01970 [Candidatus Brocadiaceae bacterium]